MPQPGVAVEALPAAPPPPDMPAEPAPPATAVLPAVLVVPPVADPALAIPAVPVVPPVGGVPAVLVVPAAPPGELGLLPPPQAAANSAPVTTDDRNASESGRVLMSFVPLVSGTGSGCHTQRRDRF